MKQKCPVCAKPATDPLRPFCSRGCQDRDLLQWLSDGYRIPGAAADEDLSSDGPASGVDKPGGAD